MNARAVTSHPTPLWDTPTGGSLYLVDGDRQGDTAPGTAMETAPARAARVRRGDHLFVLIHLDGPTARSLSRQLRTIVTQTYWESSGSITAALRRAVSAANRHLFQANLTAPDGRCTGGLVCAVARGEDLLVVRAGPIEAYHLHDGDLVRLTADAPPLPLGTGQVADVRLYHAFLAEDDALLLASSAPADDGDIARALAQPTVEDALDVLARSNAGGDFSALVVRGGEEPPPRREREPAASPEKQAGPSLHIPRPTWRPQETARTVFGKVASAGGRLLAGAASALRHLLPTGGRREPAPKSEPAAPAPPPAPPENRALLMPIALGIPVLLAVLVTLAYLTLGSQARYQSVVKQAQEEIALAQAATGDPETARSHWSRALEHAQTAVALRPEDPTAAALFNQAQAALDSLDGIVRLHPILLRDFGTGTVPRRLVVHGTMIFVLDPAGGWVARVTLNQSGDGLVESDSPILVQTGQRIGGGEVGHLVDCVWVKVGSGRRTSGLLVLEDGGALVDYDPSWEGEGGTPQLSRSFLQTPPITPGPVGSFEGRFYVLDRGLPQIRRYEPQGDVYPLPPSNYFAAPDQLPRPLAEAQDMAIDGNIYLLYEDGTVLKFLGGEPQPFDSSGVPGGIGQAVAMAVDPAGNGTVYIADRAGRRVVSLSPDGTFLRQFRAAEAFDALEALTVDESSKRLYTISGGRLFVAALP